jgi:[acyl-carrier-protein] S-malonyltransferase
MASARDELKSAIEKTTFYTPGCAVYQNVVAKAVVEKDEIKKNLIEQLTGAVLWTQSVRAMVEDGASHFTEIGPGKVLQGLIQKIDKTVQVDGVS